MIAILSSGNAQAITYQGAVPVSAPNAVIASANGQQFYIARAYDDTVSVYARAASGALSNVLNYVNGANGIAGLHEPWALALSPDQKYVYVVCRGSLVLDANKVPLYADTLVVFARDTSTGALTYLETHTNSTGGVAGIGLPSSVAVSGDNKHVYVTGSGDNAVAVFVRNTTGGVLTFVESDQQGSNGISALQQPGAAALSVDGKQLYVAATGSNALATFARDPSTGKLQWSGALVDGTGNIDGLASALDVVATSDGRHVYVAGEYDNAIAVFSRDVQTGALNFASVSINGSANISGLTHPVALAISSDDTKLYAVSPSDNALTVLQRDPLTGSMTFIESLVYDASATPPRDALQSVLDVLATADARNIYTASATGWIGEFSSPQADLSLSLAANAEPFIVNEPVKFSLTVTNNSAGVATGVRLSGNVPATLNIGVPQASQGSCAYAAPVMSCDLGQLAAGGSVLVEANIFPTQNQNVSVEFVAYSAQGDPNNANSVVTRSVAVIDANTPPVARDDDVVTLTTDQIPVVIDVLANDDDADAGDVVTLQGADSKSTHNGVVQIDADKKITFTRAQGFIGADEFGYTIVDRYGATASARVHVFVNAPPVAVDDRVSTTLDTAFNIVVVANDTDVNTSDILLLVNVDAVTTQRGTVQINTSTNDVTYTPPTGFIGTDTFAYTIADNHGAQSTATVTVDVAAKGVVTGAGAGVDVTPHKKKSGGGAFGTFILLQLAAGLVWRRARARMKSQYLFA